MLIRKFLDSIGLYKEILLETKEYKNNLQGFNQFNAIEERVDKLHKIITTSETDKLPTINNFVQQGKITFERIGNLLKRIAEGIIKDTGNQTQYREFRERLTRYIGN
jgi:hypothetical protein